MSPWVLPLIVIAYFSVLIFISFLTSRGADNATFFVGNRKSPWFLVAFGMIGASISGVTFISIPGEVGNSMFSYMQVVFGYFAGYLVIANVLLPLYYRMNLSSIYVYLEKRFGWHSYKTGAFYFLLSRVIGAAFRLYLVAMVIDAFALSRLGIPFWITVCITISLIYLYSFKAGIRTIVYTDTLQTTFLLLGVVLSIVMISRELGFSFTDICSNISESRYSKLFIWDWRPGNNFFKHFLSGVFICITMTGLDQDMMQKNLSCRNIQEAKKNMYWMSSLLIVVNILFLSLGALLYIYSNTKGIIIEHFAQPDLFKKCPIELLNPLTGIFSCEKTDALFPFLVFNYLPPLVSIVFVIGLVAAAYSSADSALTALTTSFCVDFLNFKEDNQRMGIRKLVHVGFSVLLIIVILTFSAITNQSVINSLFTIAGYTYGPLLGLFSFGILTKYKTGEKWVPAITVAAIILSYLTSLYSEELFNGYKVGFEIVVLNGLLVFLGLFLSRRRKTAF
ncbi:MAG: sodium:solute symporter [Bacteroidales bacterium]|nr:sodium:solute symporter [Bacteroidales bacterium]MBN2762386.1 sodium:solute symporter [Bacteroidales bacterium]